MYFSKPSAPILCANSLRGVHVVDGGGGMKAGDGGWVAGDGISHMFGWQPQEWEGSHSESDLGDEVGVTEAPAGDSMQGENRNFASPFGVREEKCECWENGTSAEAPGRDSSGQAPSPHPDPPSQKHPTSWFTRFICFLWRRGWAGGGPGLLRAWCRF